jgi:hypothetical protein
MADLSKLRRRSTLGAPPPVTEASTNLDSPEAVLPSLPRMAEPTAIAPSHPAGQGQGQGQGRRRDGRSARRTSRTVQFATRVSPAFDERLRDIAERDGLLLVEVLERALDAYEAQKGSS